MTRPRTVVGVIVLLVFFCSSIFLATSVAALSPEQKRLFQAGILYFDIDDSPDCEPGISAAPGSSSIVANNLDYKGREILNEAQIAAITELMPLYQQAAQEIGIPWQMLAAIHYRETRFAKANHPNGQGVFQDYERGGNNGQDYPPGPVDDAEFLRQATYAARILQGKTSLELDATGSDPNAVKDSLYGYNGKISGYSRQAESLGFDPSTQAFEGSPYVMNKADEKRDPEINPNGWGQIKTDASGTLIYPANSDYGAFVVYSALAGLATGCSNNTGGTVVEVAKQELASGASQANGGFKKYTMGRDQLWCADFVSWVFKTAGKPFTDGVDGWNIAWVPNLQAYGEQHGWWHPISEEGLVPQPGDIVIFGPDHTSIVIDYDATSNTLTTIGGNEGNKVNQAQFQADKGSTVSGKSGITGYIRIP